MERKRKLFVAKTAVVLGAIPILIWAHEYGPDAGYCGVPGELGTCLNSGCHTGTLNGSGGSVKVAFPNGTTYTPGVKQHLMVTIADSAATQRAWGFQLTARQASQTTSMAGAFNSTDQFTGLQCASSVNVENDLGAVITLPTTQVCPTGKPLEYIEHSLAGYQSTLNQGGSATYQFDWTPPATNVGNITVYVAGNAGLGGPQPVATNAHVYTTTYTLTPAAASGPTPAIAAGGAVSAGAFGGFASVAPGSWMEIYGSNLSATSRQWAGSDFNGTAAPTMLDNVMVTIGGQPAFIDFISSGQVNAQVPSNVATGTVPLTITNSGGTSAAYSITVNALQPGLLAPPSFNIGGKQYVVAQLQDGSFVLPPNSISGLTTRQAKPGETIVIYGIGFGPVITSSNVNIPAGQIVQASNQLTNPMKIQFGSAAPVSPGYAGLAPNFVGLYQFNVQVPAVPDNDLVPLAFTLNGAAGSQTLFTAVHQ